MLARHACQHRLYALEMEELHWIMAHIVHRKETWSNNCFWGCHQRFCGFDVVSMASRVLLVTSMSFKGPIFFLLHLLVEMFRLATTQLVGILRQWGYYLADAIYPSWSTFVKTISNLTTKKQVEFDKAQVACQSTLRELFRVLQAR
jgi:hypothetical protein